MGEAVGWQALIANSAPSRTKRSDAFCLPVTQEVLFFVLDKDILNMGTVLALIHEAGAWGRQRRV
jgi:hypothetical protein